MKGLTAKLHAALDKYKVTNWLGVLLFAVLLLRIPSFFEPYYYGDEMIYMTLGQGIRQGDVLYQDIHDNKPPLLYLTAALSGNLFWFKAILSFWIIATIVIFWNFAQKLLPKTYKAATIIFALLTTLPLLEGNTVNAELFMIGPIILAFYLLLFGKTGPKIIFTAGAFFGIAALFKMPAMFDLPVIIAYWLVTLGLKNWKEIMRNTFILLSGFLAPILLTFIWAALAGVLPEYVKAAFLQNVGYVSSFRPGDVQKPFLEKNAPLLLRALIVILGSSMLFFFRKRLSHRFILASLWTLFSLFAVTLSERPYPHYLIQSIAPISILLAILFLEKGIEQVYSIIPLFLISFVPFYYHFYHYPTGAYYARFAKFAVGMTNREAYFKSFADQAPRNYEIADFISKTLRNDEKVFIWDPDSPSIYALSRRLPPIKYVADYHIKDFSSREELLKSLTEVRPKMIILTSGNPLPGIDNILDAGYILVAQIGNADIWTKYAN